MSDELTCDFVGLGQRDVSTTQVVNLDTTAFIALCSETTWNPDGVLRTLNEEEKAKRIRQFEDEQRNPLALQAFMEKLISSQTLFYVTDVVENELRVILSTLAGPRELERASLVFSRSIRLDTSKHDTTKKTVECHIESIDQSRRIGVPCTIERQGGMTNFTRALLQDKRRLQQEDGEEDTDTRVMTKRFKTEDRGLAQGGDMDDLWGGALVAEATRLAAASPVPIPLDPIGTTTLVRGTEQRSSETHMALVDEDGAVLCAEVEEVPEAAAGNEEEDCWMEGGDMWPSKAKRLRRHADEVRRLAEVKVDLGKALKVTKRIQPRHIRVFGAAAALGVPTLTSDSSFIRAAGMQGVDVEKAGIAILHSPRSLATL